MSEATNSAVEPALAVRLYRAIWRWHFYAGLVVVPFLMVMALTGLVMVYGNFFETALGTRHHVSANAAPARLVDQANIAAAAVPDGSVKLVVVPATKDRASVFIVETNGKNIVVNVDPNGPAIIGTHAKDDTWYNWASNIHGTLLIGKVGDRMLEVVAGLGIILVLTGLYMWWPRSGRGWSRALVPNLSARGRVLWKELHVTAGFYMSFVLVFFLVSGLAWTGIWGEKITQAWSTFPAAKWDNVPLSDKTHAAMNHGALKEVPWALEQTPMPASGSRAGVSGVPHGVPVDLDSVTALGRAIGFGGQFRINVPSAEDGVFTISADSMDGDTTNIAGDRTVHIDRYSGKVLADVRFADYSLPGKAMAIGVTLHQGNLGLPNTLLNVLFCLFILFMCISGVVMWWKRKPEGKFGVPLYPREFKAPIAILLIGLAVCLLFPLTGIAVAVFALADFLLPRRFKEAGMATETA